MTRWLCHGLLMRHQNDASFSTFLVSRKESDLRGRLIQTVVQEAYEIIIAEIEDFFGPRPICHVCGHNLIVMSERAHDWILNTDLRWAIIEYVGFKVNGLFNVAIFLLQCRSLPLHESIGVNYWDKSFVTEKDGPSSKLLSFVDY